MSDESYVDVINRYVYEQQYRTKEFEKLYIFANLCLEYYEYLLGSFKSAGIETDMPITGCDDVTMTTAMLKKLIKNRGLFEPEKAENAHGRATIAAAVVYSRSYIRAACKYLSEKQRIEAFERGKDNIKI